jgi:hypothetical protein
VPALTSCEHGQPLREILDARADRLGAVIVCQHLRRFIDSDDRMAEFDQRIGDPAGS